MDLSIIIVSWNTAKILTNCLTSIYAHPVDADFEVVLVDNASTDSTVKQVTQQFPQVKLLENDQNVGFARANNQGIAQSAGRYVLLLNPDTEVRPRALNELVHFMELTADAGAVGALTLNPDGTLQTSCYPKPTLLREIWRLFHLDIVWPYGSYRMSNWSQDQARKVDALLGACLMVRREILDEVGLFDEDYFIYSEEIDLCYRLLRAGWGLYWVPQAQIVHYGGQSTQQVATEMFVHLYQGKIIFFRKHYGRLAAQTYKLVLFVISLVRLILSPLAWFESAAQRQRHLTLAGNYRRLLLGLMRM